MVNNNKFYKIGVAVSVLLIGVIVACIVIAQKQDDKVAKAEDFPSVLNIRFSLGSKNEPREESS